AARDRVVVRRNVEFVGAVCGVVLLRSSHGQRWRVGRDQAPARTNSRGGRTMRALILWFAFFATLLIPALLLVLFPPWWLIAIGVMALSHALVLWPTLRPNSQWLGPVITHFETSSKEVWLTID